MPKPIYITPHVAIYIRVSTIEQAKEGMSIQAQKTSLIEYAQKHYWKIYDLYIDEGYSGSNTKRPEFQRLMKDARQRKFRYVLVYKLDRLHRNVFQLLQTINELKENKVQFISQSEGIDSYTAVGNMQLGILGTIAQFERDILIDRIKYVYDEMEKKGKVYLKLPLGYSAVRDEHHHIIKVVLNKDADLVRDIFRAKLYGKPIRWICSSTGFTIGGLYSLFHNPFYAGYVRFRNKWFKMPHEPLISLPKWLRLADGNLEAYQNAKRINFVPIEKAKVKAIRELKECQL